jgi:sulfoxide reductase catalytic subunit YedY
MLIKKPSDIPSSEITPQSLFMNRRKFIAGAAATGAAIAADLYLPNVTCQAAELVQAGAKLTGIAKSHYSTSEKSNSFKDITTYNKYIEFSKDMYEPNGLSANFRTRPWTVSVEGLVKKPRTIDVDTIIRLAPLEERVYRHRCVEGWSMVIPWVGFPLSALIQQAAPLGSAKFVAFETILAPDQMPGQKLDVLSWPYAEGLRMDEAMHPLTILATGLYDNLLPNVNGAPLRLVVPWKYGFKSIKAIVKIKFVDAMPPASWNIMAPDEYGFYANVNPNVNRPLWSQATERRIADPILAPKRQTLMFNGYGDQVASLYSGMDLRKYF